jgi:hypothetical protein
MAIEERGYQQQSGPGRSAALPSANADAFGADVGAAIGRVGDSLHRAKISAYQIERQQKADQEAADFNARFAAARERMDKLSLDLRNSPAPGGAGHAQAIGDAWEAESSELVKGLTETRLINSAREQMAQFGARARGSAYEYEQGARIGKMVADHQAAADIVGNRLQRDPDPSKFREELEFARQGVAAMTGLSADVQEKILRYKEQAAALGFAGGMREQNPLALKVLLDRGQFDDLVSPDQMRALRNGADAAIDRQRIAGERVAREQAQLATNAEDALKLQADDGGAVDPNALRAAAERAEAEGKPDRAYTFRASAVKAEINTRYGDGNADAGQISQRMGVIERTADWRSKPDLVTEHEQLDTLRTKMREAEPNYASALDDANPASFAQRERDAVADAQRRGLAVPQPLGPDDVERYQALAKSGLAGQIKVADALAHFSTGAAMAAARQVDPGNRLMIVATTLTPQSRALLLRGEAAGKINPGAVTPSLLDTKFGRSVGGALVQMGVDYQLGVKQAVEGIADTLVVVRRAKALTDEIWDEALHRALGGTWARNGVKQGGVGEWNGKKIVLPYRMSQEDFDREFSRRNMTGAHSSGGTVSAAEIRRYYTPVNVGGDRYAMVDSAGRALKAKDGTDFTVYFSWNGK